MCYSQEKENSPGTYRPSPYRYSEPNLPAVRCNRKEHVREPFPDRRRRSTTLGFVTHLHRTYATCPTHTACLPHHTRSPFAYLFGTLPAVSWIDQLNTPYPTIACWGLCYTQVGLPSLFPLPLQTHTTHRDSLPPPSNHYLPHIYVVYFPSHFHHGCFLQTRHYPHHRHDRLPNHTHIPFTLEPPPCLASWTFFYYTVLIWTDSSYHGPFWEPSTTWFHMDQPDIHTQTPCDWGVCLGWDGDSPPAL